MGLLLTLALVGAVPADKESAFLAEEEGRWSDAAERWETLAADGNREAVAHHLRVLEVMGSHELLEAAARKASRDDPLWDVPVIQAARALAARGRAVDALALIESSSAESLPLQEVRGHMAHLAGDRDTAHRIMADVLNGFGKLANPSPHDRLAAAGAARYEGAFERAQAHYQRAYTDSTDFLEARLGLALLFREKYQGNLADEEMADAFRIHPHHPDVHLAMARIALVGNRFAQAHEEAQKTLAVRPQDAGARVVLAHLALISEQTRRAREWIEPALEQNPQDLPSRAILAAAAYLDGDTDVYERELQRIHSQDHAYLEVYLELAELLESSRRNEEAFALYETVLDRDPDNPAALIATGLLYMREGNESEARGFLERGFEGDPFNIRAYNQLELLDLMDTFSSYDSEHFEIRLDANTDSLLVPLLRESLEAIYEDLVASHGWKPTRKTVVEVLPAHDWFSARVTGLPWIGGIPAVCFGDVVAMDSPRTLAGRSNWRDILRHEFGHVLALGMTNRRVPFWFTEGLSVFLEEFPRSESWDANLRGFYVDGDLVPVDSLTLAFTRPRSHAQRLLAYHEAGLIIENLVKEKGWEVIPKLLLAFGEGLTLDEALRREAGMTLAEFSEMSLEVVRETAESLPVWPAPSRDRFARLSVLAEGGEEDVEFLELLAVTQYQFQEIETLEATAKRLLEKDVDNVRGHGMLGLVANARSRSAGGSSLERAIDLGSRDIPVYQALARLRLSERDTTAAIDLYEQILSFYPGSVQAQIFRARLNAAIGNTEAARAGFRELLTVNAAVADPALELARLELESGTAEGALAAVEYAEGVLPLSAGLEALRGRAYLDMDRNEEAYEQFLFARKLDRRNIETMVGMALYYLKHGDLDEAAYFAQLALRYQPDHPKARDVLRRVTGD